MSTWRDVAGVVGSLAPTVGAALAGPGGAVVGGLLASRLGTSETADAVLEEISKNPASIERINEVEASLSIALVNARGQAIVAEAQGESWLQRNWRPVVMLMFTAFVGAHFMGLTSDTISEASIESIMDIIQLGIGGYVIGRSAEKVTRLATGSGIFDNLKAKVAR